MKKIKYLSVALMLTIGFAVVVKAQSDSVRPKPKVVAESTGESVENGVFTSINGKFSIAIPELPKQRLEFGTEKARAKGIDIGKQFVWVFEKTFYTLYYNPGFDPDGNGWVQDLTSMVTESRKGILRTKATIISEKPIKLGSYRGTELRSVDSIGVKYIARVYLVGNTGYQLVGGYADEKDEKAVITILDSFTPR
jgi:hypothetical protein